MYTFKKITNGVIITRAQDSIFPEKVWACDPAKDILPDERLTDNVLIPLQAGPVQNNKISVPYDEIDWDNCDPVINPAPSTRNETIETLKESFFFNVDNFFPPDSNGFLYNDGIGNISWQQASIGISVGSTPIVSGTVGRVLFEGSGNVVQQDGGFFWDNTNKSLGVGATPGSTPRLDIRAKGTLSTDIAIRVRNSVNSQDLFSVNGDGSLTVQWNGDVQSTIINGTRLGLWATAIGFMTAAGLRSTAVGRNCRSEYFDGVAVGYGVNVSSPSGDGIGFGHTISTGSPVSISLGRNIFNYVGIAIGRDISFSGIGNNTHFIGVGLQDTSPNTATNTYHTFGFGSYNTTGNRPGLTYRSNGLNQLLVGYYVTEPNYSNADGTNWIGIKKGTPPTGAFGAFQMYAADIVLGNAAPHFRTENGSIIRLYSETISVASASYTSNSGTQITTDDTFDGYTIGQVVRALRNFGLLA